MEWQQEITGYLSWQLWRSSVIQHFSVPVDEDHSSLWALNIATAHEVCKQKECVCVFLTYIYVCVFAYTGMS